MTNATKKVCQCCRHVFRPQFSDEDMLSLYYTDEQLDRMRALAEDYPTHAQMPQVPTQELCLDCAMNPGLRVEHVMFGPPRYFIEEKGAQKAAKRPDVKVEPPEKLTFLAISRGADVKEAVGRAMRLYRDGKITSEKKKRPWWRFWK